MDRGIKTLKKHLEKIEKSNNSILDKTLASALKLKYTKLSDISARKLTRFEILIHKDTNNFPLMKQKLLSKISDLHLQYPFITLCFDPIPQLQPNMNTPTASRCLKSENENRLILTIMWEDYIRYSMNNMQNMSENRPVALPGADIQGAFNEVKRKNLNTLQNSINDILSKASQHTLDEKTDTNVALETNTMACEVTRNHFVTVAQDIMRHYNGMIEIFNINSSVVTIRVHWNIYLSQVAAMEKKQYQVPLLPGPPTVNYLHPTNESRHVRSHHSGHSHHNPEKGADQHTQSQETRHRRHHRVKGRRHRRDKNKDDRVQLLEGNMQVSTNTPKLSAESESSSDSSLSETATLNEGMVSYPNLNTYPQYSLTPAYPPQYTIHTPNQAPQQSPYQILDSHALLMGAPKPPEDNPSIHVVPDAIRAPQENPKIMVKAHSN